MCIINVDVFFRIGKNGQWRIAIQSGKCWISATERFQRNAQREIPTNILTFVACWVCDSVFKTKRCSKHEMLTNENRQTDNPITVTLTAHACRGLMKQYNIKQSYSNSCHSNTAIGHAPTRGGAMHTYKSTLHAPITSLEWLNLPLLPFLPFHNLPFWPRSYPEELGCMAQSMDGAVSWIFHVVWSYNYSIPSLRLRRRHMC